MRHLMHYRKQLIPILWTAAVGLMSLAMVQVSDDESLAAVTALAAVFLAIMACIPTGAEVMDYIVECHRDRAVREIGQAIGYAEARRDVGRIDH